MKENKEKNFVMDQGFIGDIRSIIQLRTRCVRN